MTYSGDVAYSVYLESEVMAWLQVSVYIIFPLVHSHKQPLKKHMTRKNSLYQPSPSLTGANWTKILVN